MVIISGGVWLISAPVPFMQLQYELNILRNVLWLYLDWQQIQTQSLLSQSRYQPPVESETSPPRGVCSMKCLVVLLLISH